MKRFSELVSSVTSQWFLQDIFFNCFAGVPTGNSSKIVFFLIPPVVFQWHAFPWGIATGTILKKQKRENFWEDFVNIEK